VESGGGHRTRTLDAIGKAVETDQECVFREPDMSLGQVSEGRKALLDFRAMVLGDLDGVGEIRSNFILRKALFPRSVFSVVLNTSTDSSYSYMQKITPFLWFDGKVEEAMNFYVSTFKNSKVLSVNRNGEDGPGSKGTVTSASFQLEGQQFLALNGGPHFTFTPAISFFVDCETQQEVDKLWEKLSEGGEKQRCGWLKDKFGLSWQVIPSVLGDLLQDKDPEKSDRVWKAMLEMDKINIKALQQAYQG
jgi:predicted 3-demethylubiquinone-9 3-methyltransferase (glyoxalase superfamily)